MNSIVLATEDDLSESVGTCLIKKFVSESIHITPLGKKGNGYLRRKLPNFLEISLHKPVLLITDLDREKCAPSLKKKWATRKVPKNLLFRVAVREVEAWLLADHVALKKLFGKKVSRFPARPDEVDDPKRTLLKLAEKAPRVIRNELLAQSGNIAGQGLGYNSCLSDFVATAWSPLRAKERSDSLRRTCERLQMLANLYTGE
jgi:hypothetical protein